MATLPLRAMSNHWNHWSVTAWPRPVEAVGMLRTLVEVPLNVAPAFVDVLTTILLLQAPAVFTPVYKPPVEPGSVPVGTQPLLSLEFRLMYEAIETMTCLEFCGFTAPDA